MNNFIVLVATVVASGAAHAGRPQLVQSVPTLGEIAVVGLAIVVGVVGGKLVAKYRRK